MVVYAWLYFRTEMERAEMTDKLFHLANHDALTGLANRNLLNDRLGHAITQTARQKGQLAVLFLDLVDFKDINDTYGHDAGDGVLKRVAERSRACVRAGDTIAGDQALPELWRTESVDHHDSVIRDHKAGIAVPATVVFIGFCNVTEQKPGAFIQSIGVQRRVIRV